METGRQILMHLVRQKPMLTVIYLQKHSEIKRQTLKPKDLKRPKEIN